MQTTLTSFIIILLSKAFLPSLLTSGDRTVINPEEGLWQFQLLVSIAYGATAIFFLRDAQRMKRAVCASWPLWFIGAVAMASAFWSIDPQMTVRRSVGLLGTTLLGVYIGSTVDITTLRRAMLTAAWITVLGSAVMVLFIPDLGIHHDLHDGYWRGAFLHKNNLGQFACLAIVCFMLECLHKRKLSVAPIVGIALSLWLLVGAGSRTAWVMTPILVVLVLTFAKWEQRKFLKIGVVTALLLAFVAPSIDWSVVGDLLGRDESLTGRLPLWSLVWEDIVDRPVLGYGYGAYWLGKAGLSRLHWATLGWQDSPNQAHNGFLDLWLECGLGGILALVSAFVVFFRAPSSDVPVDRASEWAFVALIIGFGCVGGELVVQNSVSWLLITAVITQRSLRGWAPVKERVGRRPLVRDAYLPSRGEYVASAGS
jgi:O-antigen ligase